MNIKKRLCSLGQIVAVRNPDRMDMVSCLKIKLLVTLYIGLLVLAFSGCGSRANGTDYPDRNRSRPDRNVIADESDYLDRDVIADDTNYPDYSESAIIIEVPPPPPRIRTHTGNFQFTMPGAYEDSSAYFFWDEEYFSYPADLYNESLATMSLAFAISAFASNTDVQASNAIDLLEQIGFESIETNYYFTTAPHENSIGVIAAHQYIEANGGYYTLIAIATRGGNYDIEWAGNFTMGIESYHMGFRLGAEETLRFVEEYVARHRHSFEENIKIWIAGFSRGGAVVNLAAAWLSEAGEISGMPLSRENIFVYTFASPKTAPIVYIENRDAFTNIHNILNPADIVTWVMPYDWGFGRFGTDHFMPDTDIIQSVGFGGVNIIPPGLNLTYSYRLMSAFVLELTELIAVGAVDRENFTAYFQDAMGDFMRAVLWDEWLGERLVMARDNFFARFSLANAGEIILAFVSDGITGLVDLTVQFFHDSMEEAGIYLGRGTAIFDVVAASFDGRGLDIMLTLVYNIDNLAAAHHPKTILDWLMSQDSNFN